LGHFYYNNKEARGFGDYSNMRGNYFRRDPSTSVGPLLGKIEAALITGLRKSARL